MTNHKRYTNNFLGGVQLDTDARDLTPEDYINGMNINTGIGFPQVQNIKGNETPDISDFNLPAGLNVVIGTVEDRVTNSLIYFIWNDSNAHSIVKWYSEGKDIYNYKGETKLIYRGSSLGFLQYQRIHSAEVIDGRYLVWTDGLSVNGVDVLGGVPKKINIEKASKLDRILTTEIFFTDFLIGSQYFLNIIDTDGTSSGSILIHTSTVNTLDSFLTALSAAAAFYDFEYIVCNNKIIITPEVTDKEYIFTSTSSTFFSIPGNYYPALSPEHFTLKKPQPKKALSPYYAIDSSIKTNYLLGYSFQFMYRYVFDDGERSSWSPYSYVATNYEAVNTQPGLLNWYDIENSRRANVMYLDFDDEYLSDLTWRVFIKKVEIAVRYESDSPFYSLGTYDINEIAITFSGSIIGYKFRFLNDKKFGVVSSDEVTSNGAQAFKPFSHIPKKVTTLRSIVDKDGVLRLALGGCVEGYNLPECVRSDLEIVTQSSDIDSSSSIFDTNRKSFKAGGIYKLGIIYEDELGRQSPVMPLHEVKFPFKDASNGSYKNDVKGFELTINQDAPAWADRYRLAVTKNQNQLIYWQEKVYRVRYWEIDPETGVGTASNSTDATHVGFEFTLQDIQGESFDNILFDFANDVYGKFQVLKNDRLQIVDYRDSSYLPGESSFSNELLASDFNTLNYQIDGYSLGYPDGSASYQKYVIFIKYTSDMDNNFWIIGTSVDPLAATPYLACEVYRKKTVEDSVYYELPDTYSITNLVHQSPVTVIERGDTYNIADNSFDIVSSIERPSMNIRDYVILNDLGRPVAEDADYKEVFDYSKIRISDAYLSLSDFNNINAFRGSEYIRLSRDYGWIVKFAKISSNLLVVCSRKIQSIYVGAGYVQNLDGEKQISRSEKILNVANPVVRDWGSIHPMSISEGGNAVYGYDRHNRLIWQFSQNGLKPISFRGIDTWVVEKSISKEADSLISDYIISGYDQAYKRFYITFRSLRFENTTWGYDTVNDRWIGQYGFIPEYYGRAGTRMVTMRNGQIWVHDTDNYCNFYGQQQTWYIEFSVNPDPEFVKHLHRVMVMCNRSVNVTLEVDADLSYPEGKSTRILSKNFNILEGQQNADYLRDLNDTNPLLTNDQQRLLSGRVIRGDHFRVRVYADDASVLSKLYRVIHFYTTSENVN